MLGAQLGFLRHRADDGDAPGFVGVSLHGLFLHFVAAFVADLERRVHQVVPLLRNAEGAFLVALPDAIQAPGLALGIAAPGLVNPFGLFFADHGITVLFQHFSECHIRLEPGDVGDRFHEFPNLRKFQAGIRKDRRHIRVHIPNKMQKDGGIFASGEGDIDHAVPMLIPFADALLRHDHLGRKRQRLHLL